MSFNFCKSIGRFKSEVSDLYWDTTVDFLKYLSVLSASAFLTIKNGEIISNKRSKLFFLWILIFPAGLLLFGCILGGSRLNSTSNFLSMPSNASSIGFDTVCMVSLTSIEERLTPPLIRNRAYKQPSPSMIPANQPSSYSDISIVCVILHDLGMKVKRNSGNPAMGILSQATADIISVEGAETTRVSSNNNLSHERPTPLMGDDIA